jgi:serine/threonine protein kinase
MEDPEGWARIKELFDQLVSRTPEEQEQVLLALHGSSSDLRREVARLLAHAKSGSLSVIDGFAGDLLAQSSGPAPDAFGRFVVHRRLGSGGMGIVYEAFDPLRATRVALKALTCVTPQSVALFKNEFRSLANLHHPNLVTLYDLFGQDHHWFFTMEFVEGQTLSEHLHGTQDRWTAIRNALAPLAQGLAALHRARKLHRDVKPSNIMMARDGRVVILDFGLVADLEPSPGNHELFAGTPRYMSPEQLRREPLTTASDCYSLGVVVFEALTGHLPQPASGPGDRQLSQMPRSGRFGQIPDDLASIGEALLQWAPEQRPTAAEVVGRLQPTGVTLESSDRPRTLPIAHPIVGRADELRILESAWRSTDAGPVVIGIEGQPGVGKTTLVNSFLTGVRSQASTLVLEARCYERESISFNVFDSLSEGLSVHLRMMDTARLSGVLPPEIDVLGRMFPKLEWLGTLARQAPPHLDRQQLRRAGGRVLRELFRNVGRTATLVVFVDDLQWADLDSAEMLVELLRDAGSLTLLLMLGFRAETHPRSPALAFLLAAVAELRGVRFTHLPLQPLDPEAAAAMASQLLAPSGEHPASRERAESIARESAGNPFFIGELVAYVRRVERTRPSDFAAEGLPLTSVIRARAEQLPEAAQRLLETVAIAGRPIQSADALAAALGEDRSTTWLALLRTDRFVRTLTTAEGEFVEPFHDRLRETIVAGLAEEQRRLRHRALATTLERSAPADLELLGVHFEGAGQLDRAGSYYAKAAEQAASALAFNSAAARYEKALRLSVLPEDGRLAMVRARAQALANAGRTFEAAQSFMAAAADGSPEGLTSLSRAGYHYAASGHLADAKQAFARVNASLDIRMPLETRLAVPRLLALRGWLRVRRHRFAERPAASIPPLELTRIDASWFIGAGLGLVELMTGALFTTYALHLALRSGDPYRIARGLSWEAAIAASQSRGGKNQARALFEVCRDIVDRLQDPYCKAMLSLCEGLAEFSHGRWTSARQRLDTAEQLFVRECVGVSYELSTLNGFKLQTCVYAGRYRELRDITPAILESARTTSNLYLETFIRGAIVPLLHLADDRPDHARTSVEVALGAWTSPGYHLQHALIDQVRLCVELYDGAPLTAVSIIDRQWPLLTRSGLLYNQNLRAKLLELRARCLVALTSDNPGATGTMKAAHAAVRRLEKERERYFQGSVLSLRALLARAAGQAAVAETAMAEAVAAYDDVPMLDYAAAAAYRLAEWRADGPALTRASDGLRAEGIQNAERWAQMRAPAVIAH